MAMGRLEALLAFFLVLQSSAAGGHASLVAQEYWNSVLPSTPMPKAVRDHLRSLKLPAIGGSVAAKETNPGLLLLQGKQDTVTASEETNPGILVLQGKQDTVTASEETNPGLLLLQGKQDTVTASEETNPGLLLLQGKQDTVTASEETNPGLLLLQGKQDTVTASEEMNPGLLLLQGKQDTVTASEETNPGILLLQGKQDTVTASEETNPGLLLLQSKEAVVDGSRKQHVDSPIAFNAQGAGRSIDIASRIDRPTAPSFFPEKSLHRGAKLWFWANRDFSGDYFIPRGVAESIPFSSARLSDIMRGFSVVPKSMLARRMKDTLRRCGMPAPAAEKRRCATSLESTVDFVTSVLGSRRIATATTAVETALRGQFYTISSFSAVPIEGKTTVVCHAAAYPYTVLHCHSTASRPYMLRLVAGDGTVVPTVAMCHLDTSTWDPSLGILTAFGEKPGSCVMCHLLPEGDILWYVDKAASADA